MTSQSIAWAEEFLVKRRLERKPIDELEARKVEAFLLLEHELVETTKEARGQNG